MFTITFIDNKEELKELKLREISIINCYGY